MKRLDFYLHQSIVYLFYALFLATPLIWVSLNSELFEFPKMVFVYFITILITSLWLARSILSKKLLISKSPLDFALLLFLFSQIIATILSMNPQTSLFGYYGRFHGGLLSTISYLILFYAFITHLDRHHAKIALGFLLTSAIFSSLYALPEHFGYSFSCLAVTGNLDVSCWIQDVQTRIFGTFGQPNWLAAHLITLLPLSWAMFITPLKNFSRPRLARITFLGINIILFVTLAYSRSRSGLLGLGVAFTLFATITLVLNLKQHLKPLAIIGISLLLAAALTGTEYSPTIFQLVKNSSTSAQAPPPTPSNGTVLETGGTESGKIREIVWTGALDAFRHNPLFGTGTETFAYSYYQYRPREHNLVSEWDFLYNKAHNEWLNFAATTGIFGLGSYLLIMLAFTFLSLKHLYLTRSLSSPEQLRHPERAKPTASGMAVEGPVTPLLTSALLSGFAGLAVSNFLGFSTVAVAITFFIYPAAFLILTDHIKTPDNPPSASSPNLLQTSLLISTLIVSLGMIVGLGRYYAADLYYSSARTKDNSGQLAEAIKYFRIAISLIPTEPNYHNDYADTLSKASLAYFSQENPAQTVSLAQQAFQQSATTLKLNPYHINFYKTQAGVYIRLSAIDPSLLDVAATILEDASSLAPTDAKLTYNLGLIRLDQEDTQQAETLFATSVDLKPNYEDARVQLAQLLAAKQDYQGAREQYQYILNYVAPGNTAVKQALKDLPASD